VASDQLTIYSHTAITINYAKIQEDTLPFPVLTHLKTAMILSSRNAIRITDTQMLTLRTEGKDNLLMMGGRILTHPSSSPEKPK